MAVYKQFKIVVSATLIVIGRGEGGERGEGKYEAKSKFYSEHLKIKVSGSWLRKGLEPCPRK
jgi:hypothetical protein